MNAKLEIYVLFLLKGQYIVVRFPEEDDASGIILKNWLTSDGCLWPRQTKHLHSLLKSRATPGADWIEVPCTVVRVFETYAEARENLPRVENGSNLDGETTELGKGRRKKTNKRSHESQDENSAPSPPASMMKRKKHKHQQSSTKQPLPTLPRPQSLGHEGEDVRTHLEESLPTRSFSQRVYHGADATQGAALCRSPRELMDSLWHGDTPDSHPMQQHHYSGQQGALWTGPNTGQGPAVGFISTPTIGQGMLSQLSQRTSLEVQNVMRNTPSGTGSNVTQGSPLGFSSTPEQRMLSQPAQRRASVEVENARRNTPSEYERQLMRTMQTILLRLEQVGRQVDSIQRQLCTTTEKPPSLEKDDDVVSAAFKDIEEFLNFERKLLSDGNTKQKLMQQFYGLGGASYGAAARRMLESILSHQVAVQFSWAGQKGKRKFMDLGVTNIICKAVRRNFPDARRNEIENVIKVWLRHAGEKLQKLRMKASRTDHEECLQGGALSSPSEEEEL
ncbi:uncharacterized protein LOC119388321 isoform X2 [Rhipicephalus sanguineus]|uniref:uncharacterized protein LOC119388321 isoform X2 n=1 Tax=Rhipicephalus sanguineus TaxID=34632 RepID=UPI0018933A04|nr:uncharacterized protein LOC119388321 isoform X2 [Rhipicephalus sanguineus]